MPKTEEEFINEINAITAELSEAEIQIKQGVETEMEGLDDRVDLLCQQIEAAPAEIAAGTESALTEMISALESLAKTLQEEMQE